MYYFYETNDGSILPNLRLSCGCISSVFMPEVAISIAARTSKQTRHVMGNLCTPFCAPDDTMYIQKSISVKSSLACPKVIFLSVSVGTASKIVVASQNPSAPAAPFQFLPRVSSSRTIKNAIRRFVRSFCLSKTHQLRKITDPFKQQDSQFAAN